MWLCLTTLSFKEVTLISRPFSLAPPFNTKLPPGWFCMYGGHLKTTILSKFAKFRFLSEFGICLNWDRVQTCPSRSGRFMTWAIQGVTTRTRRSGVFLAQIALKVQVLLRSFFCLFSHLPKKKSSRLVLRHPVELEAALEV